MGFYQFCTTLICFIYLILPNAFTVQAEVVYSGPVSVRETQPFTIACNCSLFANIKWRKNGSITDFESENNFSVSAGRKFSTITVVSALPSHTGNYKCSYEVDDYGHNLTVVVGIKLDTQFDGSPCQTNDNRSRPHVQKCVIAKPYAGEFKLRCTPQTELSSNLTLAWYKAETNLPNEVKLISSTDFISFETENQVLKFKAVNPNDTGIYQCRVVTKGQESTVNVQPYTFESVEMKVLPWVKDAHKDLTVIEENPIELTCVVFTKVNVTVTWHVNTTGDVEDYTSSRGRIILQNRNLTTNGFLRINSANLTLDRGNYSCSATSEFGESLTKQSFYVRIKSKYAALWPFLGICAEVIILCTIILIYEKKRDKTELEESDTDQGPETKSSPDHGQDSVRYRK